MIDQLEPKTERVAEPPKRWDCIFVSNIWATVHCHHCNHYERAKPGDIIPACCFPHSSRDIAETHGREIEEVGNLRFLQVVAKP